LQRKGCATQKQKNWGTENGWRAKNPRVGNIRLFLLIFEKAAFGFYTFTCQKSIDSLGIYLARLLV